MPQHDKTVGSQKHGSLLKPDPTTTPNYKTVIFHFQCDARRDTISKGHPPASSAVETRTVKKVLVPARLALKV